MNSEEVGKQIEELIAVMSAQEKAHKKLQDRVVQLRADNCVRDLAWLIALLIVAVVASEFHLR